MTQIFAYGRLDEVLTFRSIQQSSEFLRVQENGQVTSILPEEACNAVAQINMLKQSPNLVLPNSTYISDDGYMRLVTLAQPTNTPGGDPNDQYYLAGAQSQWLNTPTFNWDDMLVIYYGTATYDSSYNDYAYVKQKSTCSYGDSCSAYQQDVWYQHEEDGYSQDLSTGTPGNRTIYREHAASDHLRIVYDYASSGAFAAYVNFESGQFSCTHFSNSAYQEFARSTLKQAYVLPRVYLQEYDTIFQAAYSHKLLGGDIGISIGWGAVGISFSGNNERTDYFASPMTVTY